MASVSFFHVGSTTSIAPGVTLHWWWNNAPTQRVFAFSVDTIMSLTIPPQPGSAATIEITRVEYWDKYNSPSFEKEVHFWIKNTGTIAASFNVHMAQISD